MYPQQLQLVEYKVKAEEHSNELKAIRESEVKTSGGWLGRFRRDK